MTKVDTKPKAFESFSVRNFRRFVAGQSISLIGSWIDTVAQALLVLQLTNSGIVLGLVTAARYAPVLLFTPYAGVIVDRSDKRRLLIFTASSLALLSLIMSALIAFSVVQLWMVFVIALLFGCLTALDNPARQAFIPEMVGPRLLRNAVSLNSTFVNVGRAVGPLVAAVLIATVGLAWCFVANAASFIAVLLALLSLRVTELTATRRVTRAPHQLRQGLAYARRSAVILGPLVMMALIGTFTYEFEVSLPLFSANGLGSESFYPWLIGAFGLGSVAGGLLCAVRQRTGLRMLVSATTVYAIALGCTAFAPNVWIAVPLLFVVGVASITFITTGNTTIQLASSADYRGRVTALWSTAFLGSTPIGASLIGVIGSLSSQLALATGAAACLLAAGIGVWFRRHRDQGRTSPDPPSEPDT